MVIIMRFMTKTLELNQILEKIGTYAKSDTIKDEILALEPMTDMALIERELLEVSDMLSLISRAGVIPFIIDYDIHELIRYAGLERLYSLQEILYIRLFLKMERDFHAYFRNYQKQKITGRIIDQYFEVLHQHAPLLNYIETKIDEDGQILDDATPELLKIRHGIQKLDKQLQDRLSKLIIDYATYLNEQVIVLRNNRFCIPVKDAFKHKIKGIIHDVSASKQTVYIEPEATRQLTQDIESLKVAEEKEIQKIIALMTDAIAEAKESLKDNLDTFLRLDFLQSKALYAKSIAAEKPLINDTGMITLVSAKHPLLDLKTAVPISLELNDQLRILLITGPNTGGKTVALKTVGLLTLMTQSGLLIPADPSSNIAIFDQVFADIGDEQSIQQSLSTFSSHLTKIIHMIEDVKDKTLILLDELGSGTDPNEGVSLAMAILNKLKTYNIRMMVTTHYSELKSYAFEEPHMGTASVAFDKKTLKPLYYLQMGTTGSSHAFLIAKRLGLKEDIISNAEEIYKGRQTDLAKVMEKLNDEMLYLERQKEKLKTSIEEARLEKASYQQTKDKLMKEQDQLLETIRAKEESKWKTLRDEAHQLIDDLKSKKSLSHPEIAQFKYQLNQTVPQSSSYLIEDELKKGDSVFILPYQQYGTIKSIKDSDYRVVFGNFDLVFKASDLRKDEPKKQKETVRRKPIKEETNQVTKKASFELDLRGFRYEEVKDAMDQAIDSALLTGLSSMRIIHGFGSGAVRKAVYAYIKSSPYIKTSRFGGEGEGLNGVTIITLK